LATARRRHVLHRLFDVQWHPAVRRRQPLPLFPCRGLWARQILAFLHCFCLGSPPEVQSNIKNIDSAIISTVSPRSPSAHIRNANRKQYGARFIDCHHGRVYLPAASYPGTSNAFAILPSNCSTASCPSRGRANRATACSIAASRRRISASKDTCCSATVGLGRGMDSLTMYWRIFLLCTP
jgi:hypothetical protein